MARFASLLIANRGEIALRIQRTARQMGLRTIAVYSEADRDARHAREADAAVCVGAASPRESYLNIRALLDAARRTRAAAVHPGYGFLAESADFAQAVIDAGLVWVGPPPAAIRAMGDKAKAKQLAGQAGAPVLPGYDGADQSATALTHAAQLVGFPLMVKAAAGGGGRGMRLVRERTALDAALAGARSEAEHAFDDGRLLLERALEGARHVEVQVFADAHGGCVHLGERDCSVQRRHQKIVEESPSPAVDDALRARMGAAAIAVARTVHYVGAGTVEFLLDAHGEFWFMEMNTRLQVEHPVTELRTGLDLVEWQLRVASGEALPRAQDEIRLSGHAIEVRLCAEDAAQDFLPQSGRILRWRPDPELRVDHALEDGAEVPPYYDSMIAKFAAHAPTRDAARERLAAALERTVVLGLATNKAFLAALLRDPKFAAGAATTDFLQRRGAPPVHSPDAAAFAVAAVLLAAERARRARYGEWTSWSNSPERRMRARLRTGALDAPAEVSFTFAAGLYRVSVDGREIRFRLLALGEGDARLELDADHETTVSYALEGGTIHLAWAGSSSRFEDVLHAPPARRAGSALDGRLTAPMNGRVVAVNAEPGARVAADRAVVVLEAMKMEHGLMLGAEAQVTAVHVAAGMQVAPGQLLLEFEAA
jgi:geranyl-CoA carboxylase alpha subunit